LLVYWNVEARDGGHGRLQLLQQTDAGEMEDAVVLGGVFDLDDFAKGFECQGELVC
jgi:hypothetical protein